MARRHLWKTLNELSEEKLRTEVLLPLLHRTPGIEAITDVHGTNETGLDIVFFTQDAIRRTCFGLQLKIGNIGGGGRGAQTVEQIIGQLRLARKMKHPVAVDLPGSHRIERFIVATSGNITDGARREIAESLEEAIVDYWDGHRIMRSIQEFYPELLSGVDAATLEYLRTAIEEWDRLDALDQLQPVARRTLTDIFEEPRLRRKYVSAVVSRETGTRAPSKGLRSQAESGFVPASVAAPASQPLDTGVLYTDSRPSVIIADQNDGKTSLLRMLGLRRARLLLSGDVPEGREEIPVIVSARNLLKEAALERAIRISLETLAGERLARSLDADLKDGGYIVAVDGFSELPSENDKVQCAALIEAFHKRYKGVRVLISGRPADFLEPKFFLGFAHYHIAAFNDQQVTSLAQKWTRGLMSQADVARKMVGRIKEALQLPGSPIPAIIGVMVYEEQRRYITNTADAVDTYMTIRLGRYAREMGIKQEVEWSRKQDLLGEVAFHMVENGIESIPHEECIERFDAVFGRLGEKPRGGDAIRELIESGVLIDLDGALVFHRTAFRDFFAAQHLFRRKSSDFDSFFRTHLWDKKWGSVLVFAAGLRRHNTDLLLSLAEMVRGEKEREIGPQKSNYIYGSYLLGRILTNSEASDESSRIQVLRTCLDACQESIPEFVEAVKQQYGPVGELAALVGIEQTFLVTVGVPWLELQFAKLAIDPALSEEERYLVASVYANLDGEHFSDVLADVARTTKQPRVLLVLLGLVKRLKRERKMDSAALKRLKNIERTVLRTLKKSRDEVRNLLKFKSKLIELEIARIKRLSSE